MAYMGRGGFSSFGGGCPSSGLGANDNNNDNRNNGRIYHRGPYFYRRFYYYIPLDNTYVIMQMIVTVIILIVGAISFISTYKSSILDPIASTKSLFLNTHLIIIAIFLALSFAINYSSKDEYTLIKRLTVFSIISIITMLVFFRNKIKFRFDLY